MLVPNIRASHAAAITATALFFALLVAVTVALLRQPLVPASAQPSPKGAQKLRIVSAPNPYSSARGRSVDTVVVHYISGINVSPKRWADPKVSLGILQRYHLSAHYMVDRAGTVYRLVPEHRVAWHAGGSIMPAPDNRRNVNRFSVGIEVIATATSGYTDAQYRALSTLITEIKQRHPIRHIIGHDQISGARAVTLGLRKDRKIDPGPLFDWARLRGMVRSSE